MRKNSVITVLDFPARDPVYCGFFCQTIQPQMHKHNIIVFDHDTKLTIKRLELYAHESNFEMAKERMLMDHETIAIDVNPKDLPTYVDKTKHGFNITSDAMSEYECYQYTNIFAKDNKNLI